MISVVSYVAFCIVCSVLAFRRHPIWGFYFYLATTFVYPPARWWGYLLPDLRWALLSAAITTLAVLFNRGKLNAKPPWIGSAPAVLLTLYAALMWLQTPWALAMDDHLEGSTFFVKSLFAFWLVYRLVDSKERVRDLSLAIVLGCGLLGVFAQATGREGGRLDGVGGPNLNDSNTLGMYLVTGIILAIGLVLTQSGWRRYVSLASLLLMAQGFILANSRGALVGLLAGSATLALCKASGIAGCSGRSPSWARSASRCWWTGCSSSACSRSRTSPPKARTPTRAHARGSRSPRRRSRCS
jgi:hypothetical protein